MGTFGNMICKIGQIWEWRRTRECWKNIPYSAQNSSLSLKYVDGECYKIARIINNNMILIEEVGFSTRGWYITHNYFKDLINNGRLRYLFSE